MATTHSTRARCLLAFAGVMGLTGCASEAGLQPPSLHLPAPVQHLSAERFGDAVELRWTNPQRSTDGVTLRSTKHGRGPFTVEICRSSDIVAGPCAAIAALPAVPAQPGIYLDVLRGPWAEGVSRTLHYRVRMLNARGRGGDGVDVAAVAGAALPAIEGLRAAPAAGGGVTLRWRPGPGRTPDRVLLRVTRDGETGRVQTLAVDAGALDPSGANDAGARPGVAQSYTVFRTRMVELGKQTLTLNSAVSSVTVAAGAAAPPPAAPVGLEGVVNTLGAAEIDLLWQAAEEGGVAGYRVFRAEVGGAMVVLTPEPVHGFSYADTAVHAGGRYRYRVAAVNGDGVQGAMSAEIERSVP